MDREEIREIKDSGERRQFYDNNGNELAVRDIQEGKGRCDLMPLDVIAAVMNDSIAECLEQFKLNGNIDHLYEALTLTSTKLFGNHANAFLEVSKQFEDGAKKYGECNWQKGIPVKSYVDSAVRHYLKHLSGMTDEPHDRALVWNLMCCIWTCENLPELNEYRKEVK